MKRYKDRYVEVDLDEDIDIKDAIYIGETSGSYDSVVTDYLMETLKPTKIGTIEISAEAQNQKDVVGQEMPRHVFVQNGIYGEDEKKHFDIYYDENTNILIGKMNPQFLLKDEAEESFTKALFGRGDNIDIKNYIDLIPSEDPSGADTNQDGNILFATTSEDIRNEVQKKNFDTLSFNIFNNAVGLRKTVALQEDVNYTSFFTNIHMIPGEMININGMQAQMPPKPKKPIEFYTSKTLEALEKVTEISYDEDILKRVSKKGEERLGISDDGNIKKQIDALFGGNTDVTSSDNKADDDSEIG